MTVRITPQMINSLIALPWILSACAHDQQVMEARLHVTDDEQSGYMGPQLIKGRIDLSDFSQFIPSFGKERYTINAAFDVDLAGRAKNCAAAQANDRPDLYKYACGLVVSRCRFIPGKNANGEPVVQRMKLVLNFIPRIAKRYSS